MNFFKIGICFRFPRVLIGKTGDKANKMIYIHFHDPYNLFPQQSRDGGRSLVGTVGVSGKIRRYARTLAGHLAEES
ncbi:hypothetical protein JZU69_04990, partial [bacterium]|nr:hypothetical protein [bacterium]